MDVALLFAQSMGTSMVPSNAGQDSEMRLRTLRVCPSDYRDDGQDSYELEALRRTWRRRMMDRDLIPGWPADPKTAEMSLWLKLSAAPAADIEDATPDGERNPERTHHARIVSAKGLRRRIAPNNLREALRMHNPDQPIWLGAYKEEYEALLRMNTFEIIDEEQLERYKAMGCEVVPCMTIFDIKPDEKGDPYRAKARTVVLGNLEQRTWTKDDKYSVASPGCTLERAPTLAYQPACWPSISRNHLVATSKVPATHCGI